MNKTKYVKKVTFQSNNKVFTFTSWKRLKMIYTCKQCKWSEQLKLWLLSVNKYSLSIKNTLPSNIKFLSSIATKIIYHNILFCFNTSLYIKFRFVCNKATVNHGNPATYLLVNVNNIQQFKIPSFHWDNTMLQKFCFLPFVMCQHSFLEIMKNKVDISISISVNFK